MVLAITNNTISLLKTSQALVQTELQLQKLMVSLKMEKQSRTMSTVHDFAEERRLIAFTFSTGSLFISDNWIWTTLIEKKIGGSYNSIATIGIDLMPWILVLANYASIL